MGPLDYSRTARRLGWESVPPGVVVALGSALDSRVVTAGPPVGAGFGGQYAGPVRLADGRAVFVKAAPPWLEFQSDCLDREARLLRGLPASAPHARLLAEVVADDWRLLALGLVRGRMPGSPWTAADLAAVERSCLALASAPAHSFAARTWVDRFHRGGRYDTDIAAVADGSYRRPAAHGMDPWVDEIVARHGPELAALTESSKSLRGEALLHADLRVDNLLIGCDGSAHLLDWNHVALGPPWADLLGVLPMAHAQGLDVTACLSGTLFADATATDVDAYLAATAVKLLGVQDDPLPPGVPETIWWMKLTGARDALRMLADRRGWR